MDKKVKIIIATAAVAAIGLTGYSTISKKLNQDPEITALQAEFVGEVSPGQIMRKSMFSVKGVTSAGKLVPLKNFSSKTTKAAQHGASCEIKIESQGKTATAIVDITRKPIFKKEIGYPNEEGAKVTCYENGDLEFTGKGDIINFTEDLPWKEYDYSHVYIDETLNIDSLDHWFEGNTNLVYCNDLPKTVKTMKNTFAGCTSLKKTPNYFQCTDMKIMDYAFSKCESLKEADTIPVNVSSLKYTFEYCTSLQNPISLDKTSNLINISGLYNGCTNLREATAIPDSVTAMNECYKNCINIKEAVPFPQNIQEIASAYEGDTGLIAGVTIPESVIDFTDCYNGCSALNGNLEINSDTHAFSGALVGANTNGDKLSLSGNSGNLLAIQKDSDNSNIILTDPEAAAQQNERMNREQEGEH